MAGKFSIFEGTTEPLGLSIRGKEANFAIFSSHANRVILGIFWDKNSEEIPLNRTGDIWHVAIKDFPENASYAYRCEGPKELLYNPEKWLSDPYAKIPDGFIRTKIALPESFDWQGVESPKIASQDLVIYEMHVRGFTKDPSSGVSKPGTYLGIIEKIPYLKKLGVNAIELMPIFDFDETYGKKPPLINYWGYSPTHFFAPKKLYAHNDPINEFKTMVRELHRNRILVILDVVYNHTGEGGDKNYYVNFRGIDNSVYYQVDEKGNYRNFTGCGNTLNANHPIVQKFILDSMQYWIDEMHVDGFRFDLASILTRDCKGAPMAHPPVLEAMAKDLVISRAKLIAEAWDAAGLYQIGCFPQWGPWAEWNGRYRDIVRCFIKGDTGKTGEFANVLSGSEMIYGASKTPLSSINFITAHDGFCLCDLVSYQNKHNEENGENNSDGSNQNESWNCGVEGKTDNPQIIALRERQMRNFLLALFLSQGIPMLLMGDEYGHSRNGNNNPYVQDNRINWFIWDHQNSKMVEFVSKLIKFRLDHDQLRLPRFSNSSEIEWFTNWSACQKLVAFCIKKPPGIYVAFNANNQPVTLTLPPGPWRTIVYTEEDWVFHSEGPIIDSIELCPYSAYLAMRDLTESETCEKE